jgi:hypothetical protein
MTVVGSSSHVTRRLPKRGAVVVVAGPEILAAEILVSDLVPDERLQLPGVWRVTAPSRPRAAHIRFKMRRMP